MLKQHWKQGDVMGIFNLNSPFMQKMSLLFDLMVLNVLTVLLSIPIITIGAASAALYDSVWRLRQHQGSLLRNYFRAFRSNFKQSTLLFLPILLIGLLLGYNWILVTLNPQTMPDALLVCLVVGTLVWAMILAWVFPLQSRFVNSWGRMIVNALICALRFLPCTIAMSVLNLVPWIVLIMSPVFFVRCGIIWLILWFALSGYWNMCLLDAPFRRLIAVANTND